MTPLPTPPHDYEGVYSMPEWQKAATEYERHLGAHLADRPEVRTAAQHALKRLHDVLTRDYILQNPATTEVEARRITAEAFFLDKATSSGQVGTGTLGYLTTNDRVTVREVMTAFFNAAYFRSETERTKTGFKDISLKATVQRIYFGPSTAAADAKKLGLNEDYLAPYTEFLVKNEFLAAQRKLLPNNLAKGLARDIFAVGCLAYYSKNHYKEYVLSQMARGWRDPEGEYTFPADYARLGGGTGLSQAECAYLGTRPVFPDLEGFDTKFTSGASPLSPEQIAEQKSKSGVIDVQESYEYTNGNRTYRGYVTVKAIKVTPHNVRAGDLDPAAYGPEFPLPWIEGWKNYGINPGSDWHRTYSVQRGYPLIAGLSGTAARLFSAYGWLQVPGTRALDFAKALLAWMLPTGDHSLYEIIKAIHIATLNTKNENETTAITANPRPLRKKRLLTIPSDNTDLDRLATALKNGAHHFYDEGVKIITGESIYHILPGGSDPLLSPPDPENIYTEKIQTADSLHLQSGMSDLYMIRAMSKYIPTVKDCGNPPDVAGARMTKREKYWFEHYDRKPEIVEWLQELECTGVELFKNFRTAHVAAVYIYTGAGYEIINRVDKQAEGKEMGGSRRAKMIAEALWYLCERRLDAGVSGKWGGEVPPEVPSNPELKSRWEAAVDAAGALASASTAGKKDAKKKFDAAKSALKSGIMSHGWADLDQELKAHTDFAFMGIRSLPPLPGPGLSLYRGTWESRGVGMNPALKDRFVTKKLTSTSKAESAAVKFARNYEDNKFLKPAVIQLTGFISTQAKNCYGYVAGVSKQPHEAEVIITKGVSFKKFVKSERDVGHPPFIALYAVYEWESSVS
ncbi:hypothetical protein [Streptomyces murinus]|uniref:hypothetical protein n=1 Tax=Streptomyces murinus TaxID=33900 RepID=UPI003F486C56